MLKNYFKIALRNIIRDKVYSSINIFGLATAITLCLLIILFIIDQKRMDSHIPERESTYRIVSHFKGNREKVRKHATSPYGILDMVALNHEEVSATSRLKREASEIRSGDKIFNFNGLYAESNFFSFFHYDLLDGDVDALKNPNSIVLSEELAAKMFPDEKAVGQQVELKDMGSYLVTGVVKDLEQRSHIDFEALLSFSSFDQRSNAKELKKDDILGSKHFYSYFKTKSDTEVIQNTLDSYVSLLPMEYQSTYAFQPQSLNGISLGPVVHGELGFVAPFFIPWFLGVLAAVVMLSATFNYVGLAIAIALRRAKEVGIRKIVGAGRRQVFVQFLVEAQVTVLISWVLALALLSFLIPAYNQLKVLRDIDGQIDLNLMENLHLYLVFFAFALVIGLIAGGYPAWYIGKMSYQKALGREQKAKSPSFLLRKSLICIQYTASLVFIITAIVLNRQSSHFFQMDYGFDKTNLINIPLKDAPYQALRSELLKEPHVEGVSVTSALPGLSLLPISDVYFEQSIEPVKAARFSVNEDFIGNFGIDLLKGRNFDGAIQSDENAIILNEKAAEALGIDPEDAGALIQLSSDGPKHRVIGVVRGFKHNMLFKESGPLVLTYAGEGERMVNIRYRNWDEKMAAASIEDTWRQFDKMHPFDYTHYEYEIADMYEEFEDIVAIVGVVSVLAILIACLGQFGMILHHVRLKVKEVGIRKTLGASIQHLIYLLSKGYAMLILISVIIGVPIAWWINNAWTNKIAYSISIDITTVVLGLVLVFVLAAVSIISLTWRTANANPVDSLRYE